MQRAGMALPFVATHNDLTSWNVLVDAGGALGIVDWEAPKHAGLPLTDFYYAVTQCVAAATQPDPFEAFRHSFLPGQSDSLPVARLHDTLCREVDVPTEAIDLCLHACWLYHAVNEMRKKPHEPPERRPYLRIVDWLANQRAGVLL
jgi:hypothetical protein